MNLQGLKMCAICEQRQKARSGLVLVQLTRRGPMHFWQRRDFASVYLRRHTTLCDRKVVPS